MKGIVGSATYLYLLALFIFSPQVAYAVDCSQYKMPIVTSSTENGTPIKQGEKIQVSLKNTSNDELTYFIYMSKDNNPCNPDLDNCVGKLPRQTLKANEVVIKEISTTPTTTVGTHYLRVTVFHYNPDCRVGYKDFAFTVVSASGGTGGGGTGGGTGGGGTESGTDTPERFTFNIPKWGSVADLEEEGGGNWIVGLLTRVANWILDLAGALAVFAIVYSGLMYITSAGNQEKSEKAKKNLIWAIVGLIVIFLSLLIIQWVRGILTTNV
uniref:Uncharacterized protein n=1 Tax=candidate division CPR3 bacterium TaxID=2268181 RepID=A0A7V3JAY2_UNCC3